MVELQVYDAEGKATSKVKFDESVFGDKVKSKTLREAGADADADGAAGAGGG